MSIATKLEDARNALREFSRQRQFKKANAARAEAAELQAALAKCRGKLEICKKDFNRVIKTQSRYIAEGRQIGADTTIQEQMLWDAAIGYMMVKEAIYALRSISTFDSVSHAYEMMGTAVDLMSERQRILPKLQLRSNKERNIYGYITSNTALKEKQEILDGFFEDLKLNGDIEACLSMARHPNEISADRRGKANGDDGRGLLQDDVIDSVLGGDDQKDGEMEISGADIDSMMDIHPPVG